jgi:transcriptional regulator with XRE-family HTH domain
MPTKSIYKAEYKVMLELLRETRKKAHRTQADLAAVLGRSQSSISDLLCGARRMDLLQLREFCLACDQDLVRFVRRLEKAIAGGPRRFAL